jgi:hypothetical protein
MKHSVTWANTYKSPINCNISMAVDDAPLKNPRASQAILLSLQRSPNGILLKSDAKF